MRLPAFAALLLASLASAPARAATPAQDSARRLAAILRANAPAIRLSTQAPLLGGQLNALAANLKSLVEEKSVTAEAARPVAEETNALLAELKRGPFDGRSVADKAEKISCDVQSLFSSEHAPGRAAGRVPEASPSNQPPPESSEMAALRSHASRMASLMSGASFDGGAPEAPVTPLAPASAPLTRPRQVAREAKPSYSAQTSSYQAALNPFLKAEHRRAIGTDGLAGSDTQKAVAFFQGKKGLPETGVIDGGTEKAILADFQERRRLPVTGALDTTTAKALRTRRMIAAAKEPVYFEGSRGDFEPKSGAQTIKNALATVYTPYLVKTRKQRKMEGPPIDHHDQAVCTLERYLAGTCPYVSVAVDPRLNVPNGTPLLIPEISRLAGRTVHFRIVDTGSKKRFKGMSHVDVATDSNQHSGYGQLISGRRFTLILPEGLRPAAF